MAFIIRAGDQPVSEAGGVTRRTVLAPDATGDGRLQIDRYQVGAGHGLPVEIARDAIGWIEMVAGDGELAGQALGANAVAFLPPGFDGRFDAASDADLIVTRIPDAVRFDARLSENPPVFSVFEWTHEPVLQSEHDGRKRIYLATEALFATSAIKGEMIIYPPGATCPEHHHEGAEHYQYVLSGTGTAVLDGTEHVLGAGDLLYNLENELHWFHNQSADDFVFVEFFVPGTCKTVWVPEAKICAWQPTGADMLGRAPSRDIPYHSHGDGTPV